MNTVRHYKTQGAAQRAANKANDLNPRDFWVIANDYGFGWFIENMETPEFDYAAELLAQKNTGIKG